MSSLHETDSCGFCGEPENLDVKDVYGFQASLSDVQIPAYCPKFTHQRAIAVLVGENSNNTGIAEAF